MVRQRKRVPSFPAMIVTIIAIFSVAVAASWTSATASAAPMPEWICFECTTDEICDQLAQGAPHHFDDDLGPITHGDLEDEFHDSCQVGTSSETGALDCDTQHSGECMDEGRQVDLLLAALREDDTEGVARLLSGSSTLTLNTERSAIQGRACNSDDVIRHISISGSQLAALNQATR